MGLFHITRRSDWEAAQQAGEYRAASLSSEGFIHLSEDRQWLGAANRFFRGQTDLVLLSLNRDRLKSPLKHEPADGELFPHLYGPLNLDAVVEVLALPVTHDGEIGIPAELLPWRHFFAR